MEKFEFDKEKIKEEALKQHAEWNKEYKENKFMFERKMRLIIEEFINSAPEDQREKLWEMQKKWDKAMKGAGNKHNRLTIAESIFMDQFINVFRPAINLFSKDKDGN